MRTFYRASKRDDRATTQHDETRRCYDDSLIIRGSLQSMTGVMEHETTDINHGTGNSWQVPLRKTTEHEAAETNHVESRNSWHESRRNTTMEAWNTRWHDGDKTEHDEIRESTTKPYGARTRRGQTRPLVSRDNLTRFEWLLWFVKWISIRKNPEFS